VLGLVVPVMARFEKGAASEVAKKLAFALAFGWRSGSPLRSLACFQFRL
jgi:hypothetical protein